MVDTGAGVGAGTLDVVVACFSVTFAVESSFGLKFQRALNNGTLACVIYAQIRDRAYFTIFHLKDRISSVGKSEYFFRSLPGVRIDPIGPGTV